MADFNYSVMKKILIMTLATLFGCGLLAQDQNVIDMINSNKGLKPVKLFWLENSNWTQQYMKRIEALTKTDLDHLIDMAQKEIEYLDGILFTRKKIIGDEKRPSKIDKKLKKYFNDPANAMEIFHQAEEMKALAQAALNEAKANKDRVYNPMPDEKLTALHYFSGNGFAGWRVSIKLVRNKDGNGGTLKIEEKRMIRQDESQPKPKTVDVDDSVFEKVYNMIKEGGLYDEANYYEPYYEVTDGTNWSLWMSFEKTNLSTGGYMAGPNHHDALREILKYLNEIANPEK